MTPDSGTGFKAPGWYRDTAGELRWWDGAQWTSAVPPATGTGRPSVKRLADGALAVVICGTAVAWLVAISIALLALLRQRPLPGLTWMIVPAVPILVVGQIVALLGQRTAMISRYGTARPSRRQREAQGWSVLPAFFDALPKAAAGTVVGLFVGGWLLAVTAAGALNAGGTNATPVLCSSVLNHTPAGCVTAAAHAAAGAHLQRFATGILSGFFALQCGMALNTRALRRHAAGGSRSG